MGNFWLPAFYPLEGKGVLYIFLASIFKVFTRVYVNVCGAHVWCLRMQRPGVDISVFIALYLIYLLFETESLPELRAHLLRLD